MPHSSPTDAELLTQWVGHQSEAAFHQLVTRYAGLVHATARRTGNDEAIASEAAQLVFILLARKAKFLTSRGSLAGWLHLTAVMQTKNLMRTSRRETRKRASLLATMENEPIPPSHDSWREMRPVLDDALSSLSAKDREALLLRFYRSLPVREIATTLGIATDAAQKRIDRATERLRGKLIQRGCQTGGSLAVVMLAGFSSDAQAATLPISTLTSRAIAAVPAGSGTLTTFFTTTAMKAASFAPPVIALILSGAWIAIHRQPIYALDRHSRLLEAAISERTSIADSNGPQMRQGSTFPGSSRNAGINWSELAARLDDANPPGFRDDLDRAMLAHQLSLLGKEEQVAGLDEIAKLEASQPVKELMEELLVFQLIKDFPDFAVMRLTDRNESLSHASRSYLAEAMENWARRDLEKAMAWMNQQISSGTFGTKALSGKNWCKIQYESALVRTLLVKGDGRTAELVEPLPTDQRQDVLTGVASDSKALGAAEEEAFAKLIRAQLPPAGQMDVFASRAGWLAGSRGLPAVSDFFKTIGATKEERERCVEQIAGFNIEGISLNRKVHREDILNLRTWLGEQTPQNMDRHTGEALARAAESHGISATGHRKMTFTEAADFAVDFSEGAGNDELLSAFLQSDVARANKAQARELAGKISDESRRAEILKKLD